MPAFAYKALTPAGAARKGRIDAESETQAIERLRAMNVTPVRLAPVRTRSWFAYDRTKPLDDREIIDLFHGLASLDGSGLALDETLDVLARTITRPRVARLLQDLAEQVRAGAGLSAAWQAVHSAGQPAPPPLAFALIGVGEASGTLADAFRQIAAATEKSAAAKKRLADAVAYPALIMLSSIAALFFLAQVVVPSFLPLFEAQGAAPPASLTALIAFKDMAPYGGLVLGLALLAVVRPPSDSVRHHRDRLVLRSPLIGPITARLETARFALALKTVLEAGLPLAEAVPIAQGVVSNRQLRTDIGAALERIRTGHTVSEAFAAVTDFPPILARLLPLAERSGRLSETMERIGAVCETEARGRIDKALRILSPALILAVGALVGVVVASLFGAILDLNETVL